jgi:hypothetical protein
VLIILFSNDKQLPSPSQKPLIFSFYPFQVSTESNELSDKLFLNSSKGLNFCRLYNWISPANFTSNNKLEYVVVSGGMTLAGSRYASKLAFEANWLHT